MCQYQPSSAPCYGVSRAAEQSVFDWPMLHLLAWAGRSVGESLIYDDFFGLLELDWSIA